MGSSNSKVCRPVVHCNTPECGPFMFEVGKDCFISASKLYGSLFVIAALLTGRNLTSPRFLFEKLFPSIIQSSLFIATTAALWARFQCLLLNLTGNHSKLNYFLAPLFGALIGIHIEKPQRRGELTVYVANHSAEVIFRMLADRGIVQPIRYGMVYLFACSLAVLLYYFTYLPHLLGTSEASFMRLFFGKEDKLDNFLINKFKLVKSFRRYIESKNPNDRTPFCKHSLNCKLYSIEGMIKGFLIGYGTRTALNLLPLLANPRKLLSIQKVLSIFGFSAVKFGVFLGLTTSGGRGIQCLLRHKRGVEDGMNELIAGFIAGLSFFLIVSTEIGMYATSKACYVLIKALAHQGTIPTIAHAEPLVFSFCTALLFYSGFFQPHYLRPSYFNFLIRAASKIYPQTFKNSENIVRTNLGPSYQVWKTEVADKVFAKLNLN